MSESRQVKRRKDREHTKYALRAADHYFSKQKIKTEEGVSSIGAYLKKLADVLPILRVGGKLINHYTLLEIEWMKGVDLKSKGNYIKSTDLVTKYCVRILKTYEEKININ